MLQVSKKLKLNTTLVQETFYSVFKSRSLYMNTFGKNTFFQVEYPI